MQTKTSVPLPIVAGGFVLFTAVFGVALYLLIERHERAEADAAALSTAQSISRSLSEFRSYYADRLLPRMVEAGVPVAHGEVADTGEALLPFTMALEFGSYLQERGSDLGYRLISRFPFPGRSDRRLDAEQLSALDQLESFQSESVGVEGRIDGRDVIRFFTPVIMAQSCVDCHNTHPESPKTDWTIGAVRGAQEVIIPLSADHAPSEDYEQSFADIVFLAVAGLLGLSGFICFLLYRDRLAVRNLEQLAELERYRSAELASSSMKLEEGVARLNAVLENAADAIITIDANGIIESVNNATEQIFGYSRGALIGSNVALLMPGSEVGKNDGDILDNLEPGQSRIVGVGREVEGQRADGSVFPLDLSIGRVDVGGRTIFIAILRDNTEHRRAEDTERMLSMVAARTDNAVIITDSDGFVEWVNEAFETISGYESEEMIGKKPGAVLQGVDTDPLAIERISAALSQGKGFSEELINYAKDGTPYWVSIDVQPVYDSAGNIKRFIAIERDITESKAREEELQEARRQAEVMQRQLTEALDALPDAFVLYDADDRIALFNARYKEFYAGSASMIEIGSSFEEVLRCGLANGQYPAGLGREEEWLAERLAAHANPSEPIEQKLEDGRWLRIVERRTPNGGNVGFRVDITELKRKQQELDEARLQAVIANEAKSRFLATMSHEIRTPLNGVIGSLSLLSDVDLDDKSRRFVITGRQAAESLLSLINDILDFSKMEAERLELDPIPVDLQRIVTDVVMVLRPKSEEKGLTLETEFASNLPQAAIVDPDRLKQILFNLAGNAVKFTEEGGVIVRCRKTADDEVPNRLRFEVEDTGKGIPDTEWENIFDEFWTSGGDAGTGLGLAICQRLVGIMEGEIGVEAGANGGSLFWFELPLEAASIEEVERRNRPFVPEHGTSGEANALSGHVLLAEDNPANQLILKSMIERFGPAVDTVGDGREALEAVIARDYDLVLMDVNMPRMTGTEAVMAIRKLIAPKAQVPVIAVTAHVMPGDRENLISEGFDGYIAKPVHWADLGHYLGEWLGDGAENGGKRAARHEPVSVDQEPSTPPVVAEADADALTGEEDGLAVFACNRNAVTELADNTSAEIAVEIIDLFHGELLKSAENIEALRMEKNWPEIGRVAHRIKGSSANLGLTGLADLCLRIEQAAASGRLREVEPLSEEYLAAIDGTCDRLREFKEHLA